MPRVRTPQTVETELLVRSRRRCTLCYALLGDCSPKRGQIAHLDRDPSNSKFENLVWLCVGHHDEYDTRTSQSKGLTSSEVRRHRDQLYALNIIVADSSPAPAQPRLFGLPNTHRQNPHFVPRPEVQGALAGLQPGDNLVLHGFGGVGKTQHAVQHAHVHRCDYRHVLWASADSPQDLSESIAVLAESPELGLGIEPSSAPVSKMRTLSDWLKTDDNWLLILDNVNSSEAAREIEHFLPSSHRGYVIITAQFTEWSPAFRKQSVEVWDEAQSVAFLTRRLAPYSFDDDGLAPLGEALAGLPLALEHAAAYMRQTRIPAGDYLRLLARDRKILLARQYPGMTDYRASVATAWEVTIRRLGLLSRQILQLGACLAPEPIPRRILGYLFVSSDNFTYHPIELAMLRRAVAGPDAINRALAELASYSLISLSDDSFSLHSLLQSVVRETSQLVRRHYYYRILRHMSGVRDRMVWGAALWPRRAACLFTTEGVVPYVSYDDEGLFDIRPYAPHIDALIGQLPQEIFGQFYDLSRLYGALRIDRDRVFSYQTGVTALRHALNITAVGSPHLREESEWLLSNLDGLYQRAVVQQGKRGSSDLGYRVRSLAWRDERTPWTVYSVLQRLADELARAGDESSARRVYRLWFDHAVADSNAPPVQRGLARLHEAVGLSNDTTVDELLDLLAEGIAVCARLDKLRGDVVCDAVWLYAYLARTPEEQAQALDWLSRTLVRTRALIPFGYLRACDVAEQIIRLLRVGGEQTQALAVCEDILRVAVRSKKLQRKHLAPFWRTRADLLKERECYAAAGRSYARCLALERALPKPSTLRIFGLPEEVAEMYRRAGCLQAARTHLLCAARSLEEAWTVNSAYSEIHAVLVALKLNENGLFAEGEALLCRAIKSREQDVASVDWRLAWMHRSYGDLLRRDKRFSAAETEFRRALALMQSITAPDDPSLLPHLTNLATLLEEQGRFNEATPLRDHCTMLNCKVVHSEP